MMKTTGKLTMVMLAAVAFLAASGLSLAEGDPAGYVLLVQQSPVDAGSVTPGVGVHKIGIGQTVSLQATPRPGFRFLYWLGDVSATSAADTVISLDSPKMVVAVFERESFDEDLPGVGLVTGLPGGGRGGLGSSPNPITSPGSVSPASGIGGFTFPGIPVIPTEDPFLVPDGDDNDNDILVPGDGNEIPEPSTILLLTIGATALLRKRQ